MLASALCTRSSERENKSSRLRASEETKIWNKRIINHHELWQCNNLKFPSILTPSAAQFRSRFCDLERLMEAAPTLSWVTAASSHSEEEKSSRDSRRWLDSAPELPGPWYSDAARHLAPSSSVNAMINHIPFTSSHQPLKAFFLFNYSESWNSLAPRRTLSRCQSPMRCNNGPHWCVEPFKNETAGFLHLIPKAMESLESHREAGENRGKCSPFFATNAFTPAQSPETWFISRINYRLTESSFLCAFSMGKPSHRLPTTLPQRCS